MNTEELCSISIFPLVTTPFAVQWSADNQISLITEKGVHILELQPSPMSPNPIVKFSRSFVNPSDILPACAFVNEIESLIWKQEREKMYSLLMEEAITPKLDGVNEIVIRVTKVEWSPKNLISPNQCALAILTTAGAVELLHKVSNEWYSICDISALQLDIVQAGIKSSLNKCMNSPSNLNNVTTENMRQLQACSMAWSELFKMGKASFAYFAVAYRSSDISIWRIPRITDFMVSLQATLVGRLELKTSVRINMLRWISASANEHLLVVGYVDGRIYGIKLTCDSDKFEIEFIEKYISDDRIAINYFHIVHKDKLRIKILVAKGIYLLLLCINWTGSLKSVQHLRTEGFSITGLSPITAQRFLIGTQNAHIFIVDTQSDNLVCTDITSHLPQTRVQYLGLAHSPNRVMFLNITSPNMVYDHLVMREPSTIHIFTLKGVEWDPLSVINNSTSLQDIWDCMEMLRVKAAKAEDPTMVLCPTTNKSESLYNLQISMWMTVMVDVCKVKKPIPNMDHIRQSKISREFPLIFIHSTCTYLENLKKKMTLSNDQKLVISLLRKYLKTYLADEDYDEKNESEERDKKKERDMREEKVRQYAQETLKATASYTALVEKCSLCDETINELSWNVTSCPSGHKLPRCAITLLQITSLEYRVCRICGQMFHLCLDQVSQEPCCQFCDIPLLHNEYALDVEESKLYGKNLSQLQVNVTESSKEQELEEPHEKSQRKNKWNTTDTYAVVVNNGDESSNITETWKKF
ncbi:uncharacterized protein LOC116841224 [Odontomachus brunneus]|uniref:uncharacterized protein LOC116841224 n=1 Tax=Odontomachus brunneus TaxID=486640 RepID=UPI0013F2AE91|nr:uncharacterized protein LOC116841224 [Odontomachus brunneus]